MGLGATPRPRRAATARKGIQAQASRTSPLWSISRHGRTQLREGVDGRKPWPTVRFKATAPVGTQCKGLVVWERSRGFRTGRECVPGPSVFRLPVPQVPPPSHLCFSGVCVSRRHAGHLAFRKQALDLTPGQTCAEQGPAVYRTRAFDGVSRRVIHWIRELQRQQLSSHGGSHWVRSRAGVHLTSTARSRSARRTQGALVLGGSHRGWGTGADCNSFWKSPHSH